VESVSRTPSVSEVVTRAAAICDPDRHDATVGAIVERFEDDDRPATAVPDLAGVISESQQGADPQSMEPATTMTAVAAAWLATNFVEGDDPERVLRESSRAAFDGRPPPPIREWLAQHRIPI
jgi:hypothetical protein